MELKLTSQGMLIYQVMGLHLLGFALTVIGRRRAG